MRYSNYLLICIVLFFGLLQSCKKKPLQKLTYEEEVFYKVFPEISNCIYEDLRLILPPPMPPEFLIKKGYVKTKNPNKAIDEWLQSEYYKDLRDKWKKRKDSILNDSEPIFIAVPDTISRFFKDDYKRLINHFNLENSDVTINDSLYNSGFRVNFDKLTSNNNKLRFKPYSSLPKTKKYWRVNFDFNFHGVISFSRILFDNTKSYAIVNTGFSRSGLDGQGYRVLLFKTEDDYWLISKIEETWES